MGCHLSIKYNFVLSESISEVTEPYVPRKSVEKLIRIGEFY